MFGNLYSETLILQILLITIVTGQFTPNPSGNTTGFNLEDGSPMNIRCWISNQQQYANSTYNLPSEDLFIKFQGNFLGNITVIGNRASLHSKQNAAVGDDFYSNESKFRAARKRRVSRETRESQLTAFFTDVKPSSVIFQWSIPSDTNCFCEPDNATLKYNIRDHPVKDAPPGSVTLAIKVLDLIPNTTYWFTIQCRPTSERYGLLWKFAEVFYVTTPPDVPYWRPEITNSSFTSEIENFTEAEQYLKVLRYVHKRTITLYWQNIPAEHENGEEFQYWIRVSSPFRPYLTKEVSASKESSYRFTGMLPGVLYRFQIFAGNIVGNSSNSSEIIVQEESSLLRGLEKIIVLSRTRGYQMFYIPPEVPQIFKSYTLFWCKSPQPRPVRCESSLKWLHLPFSGLTYNLSLSDKSVEYQFAVSLNSETETSGMIWAHCHISEKEGPILGELWTICSNFVNLLKVGPSGIWQRAAAVLYL